MTPKNATEYNDEAFERVYTMELSQALSEIATENGFEARLVNLLRKFEGTARFPFKGPLDVLFSPEQAYQAFGNLPYSGRKTQESFRRLIAMVSKSLARQNVTKPLQLLNVVDLRIHLFAEQMGYGELVVNFLKKNEGTKLFPYVTVRELLRDLGELNRVFRRLWNGGPKKQAAFGSLSNQLSEIAVDHLVRHGLSEGVPELGLLKPSVLAETLCVEQRVVNLLRDFEGLPEFPFRTARELIESPLRANEHFSRLPRAGRNSIGAFERFLDTLTSRKTQEINDLDFSDADNYLDQEPLSTLAGFASARLGNRVERFAGSKTFPYSTIGECLSNRRECVETLSQIPGIGQRSINEFTNLLRRFRDRPDMIDEELVLPMTSPSCRVALKNLGVASHVPSMVPIGRLIRILDDSRYKDTGNRKAVPSPEQRLRASVSAIVEKTNRQNADGAEVKSHQDRYQREFEALLVENDCVLLSKDLYEYLISILSERDKIVLTDRLCSNPKHAKTLNAVGAALGISRERVRQIEQKIIKKSESAGICRVAASVNDSLREVFFRVFQRFGGFIGTDDLDMIDLPSELWLLLNVAYRKLSDALDECATPVERGWVAHADGKRAKSLQNDDHLLNEVLKMSPCTVDQTHRVLGITNHETMLLVRMRPELKLRAEIVAPARMTQGMAAKISHLLSCFQLEIRQGGFFVTASSLAQRYTEATGATISDRDLVNTLRKAPSLFISVFDQYWASLVHSSSSTPGSARFDHRPEDFQYRWKPPTEENTLRSLLREILSETGPLSLAELQDRAAGVIAGDRALNSVLPIAISGAEFVRVIPGVVCLAEELTSNDLTNRLERFARDAWQIRVYIQARRSAGVVANAFPGWTNEFERLVAEYLRRSEDVSLLPSFLSICKPDSWDAPQIAKKYWMQQQQTTGRYELHEWLRLRQVDVSELQPAVLPALLVAYASGSLSWMDCNRLMGTRIDSHKGSTLLAYMILRGYLQAARHWQEPHACLIDAETFDELVSSYLKGSFPYGATTADVEELARTNWREGWTRHVEMNALLNCEIGVGRRT